MKVFSHQKVIYDLVTSPNCFDYDDLIDYLEKEKNLTLQ